MRPSLAIFQLGHRNRYQYPKAEVFERYARVRLERVRTDVSGAIEVRFGTGIGVWKFRRTHARYWHDR